MMIGKTISHYKILEKLGEGGMGEVFLAEDTRLERKVALKFLPLKMTSDREARKRFKREARAAAALNHPNIVTIYEINEFEGQVYIAMEHIEGKTLMDMKVVPIEGAIDIAKQICEGLEQAHHAGIIHRDIKLQNVILDKNNRVKILDFGLAKLKGASAITGEIFRVGTAYYISPEQAQCEELDLRTDIWSLGVVLYEMLTGYLPFKGDNERAVIYSIINESPIPPSEIRDGLPIGLEKIIFKCLRKDRNDRYPSVQPLLSDLKELKKFLKRKGKKKESLTERKQKEKPGARKETERRQATVIIGEISIYDEMPKHMDTQQVVSIVSCVERFDAIIEKYGGELGKVVGNSFAAYFGVPTAIEDAPKKAVNAAIEMRNSLYRFNHEHHLNISLDIHIGINTGIVIARAMGTDNKRDYTIMGDTVTLASQLKDLSSKGQIYVGPLTYKYTKNEFDYNELKPITLDGRIKPAAVFELLSTREKMYRPELGADRMIHSEMVGREKELNKLKLHVLKVIDGEGSIVSVIGEAGIGKSRLIAELKKMEDINNITLLEGRALSIGQNLSYHPIIDIFKNWTNIKEDDSETLSLSKLGQTIANIYTDHEGASEVFPFVATMMGMKLTGKPAERVKGIEGDAMEKLILKNIRDLLIKSSERRPIVFIIEDLHWADISSIELLESFFRAAENHPILFINVLRPACQETGERVLETTRERYGKMHVEIHLEPLDEIQCETLIRNLVKVSELPIDIRTAIANRAEGNPFFIEEVVRSFIDEGVIERRDRHFKVTEKIDSVVIPESIQDVLMARIDRLDEKTRTLLKEASVIGRSFFYKILAEVAKSTEDIDDRLEYLKGIQLVRERMRLEEIEYLFKHALAQEVAYESILLKKRKELHLNVANAIESVFSERLHEFYGMLALHYSRGENLEKAEEYLIKAGGEALKAAASSEAINYYQEALKLYLNKSGEAANPEKIAMLEKNIALAFFNKGHYVEAVKHLDDVLKCWGERRPKNKYMARLILIGNLLYILKHLYFSSKKAKKSPLERDNEIINLNEKRTIPLAHIETERFFMDSITILKRLFKLDITKVENGASIFTEGSILFSFTGISFKISKKILDHAKNFINKNDLKSLLCFKYTEIMHNYLSGNWRNQPEYDENSVDRKLSVGDVFHTGGYTFFSGFLKIEQGNFNDAHVLVDKLYEIGEVFDNDQTRGRKYLLNTKLLVKSRRLPEALKEVNTKISLQNTVGINFALCLSGMRPYIQILMRDIKGAEISLLQIKELVSHEERIVPFYICNFLMSQFLFDLCILEDAIHSKKKPKIAPLQKKAYRSGKASVKNAMKYAADKTEAFKLMGVYNWLIGKQKKALVWWDRSIRIGEHLGARPELARTYMEVGKRLLEKKSKFQQLNGTKAGEYLKKARVLFKKMELKWDLEQLDRIRR